MQSSLGTTGSFPEDRIKTEPPVESNSQQPKINDEEMGANF